MTAKIDTKNIITWCPGCTNFMILAAVKKVFSKLIAEGLKQQEIAIVTGIGCHAKMFDALNVSAIYGLHGRVLPASLGLKLGNPNLTVIGFAGDGDTYAEGMEHFIHAARHNADFTLVVHNNQTFSLTTGQATPTSQLGFKTKSEPLGEFEEPINPIKLALASGASFVARCNARDIEHTAYVLEKAIKHKGFSFIDVLQECIIFNPYKNINERMYKIENTDNLAEAMKLADEWDYNRKTGKIPIGIFFQKEKADLEDKWPQLKELKNKKIGWKDLKK